MAYSIKTNIVPLLESLVNALQPFARGNFVHLRFESLSEEIVVAHHPESILPDLTRLICRIVTFTPQEYEVTVKIHDLDPAGDSAVRVSISNSGVDLANVRKRVLEGIQGGMKVVSVEEKGTLFEWTVPLEEQPPNEEERENTRVIGTNDPIAPFYSSLKKHLTTHFTNIGNLEKAADAHSQRDGVFLKKINAVIMAHLEEEAFEYGHAGQSVGSEPHSVAPAPEVAHWFCTGALHQVRTSAKGEGIPGTGRRDRWRSGV